MSEIKVNNGNIEEALKRFKRQCARNGVMQEVRKREHYEKPSVKRKKKSEAARKSDLRFRGGGSWIRDGAQAQLVLARTRMGVQGREASHHCRGVSERSRTSNA